MRQLSTISNDLGQDSHSQEDILHVCGALRSNQFSHNGGYRLSFELSHINHSCTPNCQIVNDDSHRMELRARIDLKEGDQLFISYAELGWSSLAINKYLLNKYYFQCTCNFCTNPTESDKSLGAQISQRGGLLQSTNPRNVEAPWRCPMGVQIDAQRVTNLNLTMWNRLMGVVNSGYTTNKVDALETLLKQFSSRLHPGHYCLLRIKRALLSLYGRQQGFSMDDLTTDQLKRKEKLCREVMKAMAKFDRGQSVTFGVYYLEIQAAVFVRVLKQFNDKRLTREEWDEMIGLIKECVDYTQKAVSCFQAWTNSHRHGSRANLLDILYENLKSLQKYLSKAKYSGVHPCSITGILWRSPGVPD